MLAEGVMFLECSAEFNNHEGLIWNKDIDTQMKARLSPSP